MAKKKFWKKSFFRSKLAQWSWISKIEIFLEKIDWNDAFSKLPGHMQSTRSWLVLLSLSFRLGTIYRWKLSPTHTSLYFLNAVLNEKMSQITEEIENHATAFGEIFDNLSSDDDDEDNPDLYNPTLDYSSESEDSDNEGRVQFSCWSLYDIIYIFLQIFLSERKTIFSYIFSNW